MITQNNSSVQKEKLYNNIFMFVHVETRQWID